MTDLAIQCRGLGKRYRRGNAAAYRRFSEFLTGMATLPWQWATSLARRPPAAPAQPDDGDGSGWFWALKDVDLDIRSGEVLGIIGRNGAGKSTLLKVLSRITEPTTGEADIYGRVGSLLEVGTGFHPELTGRENIYLYGAVLGMTRAEIRRKFDEIVSFAEVEQFLDLAVKRYSSGMYTRLAFAVAAHLDPEILIVDEVLAVGDAAFQSKCLGKMETVASHGRTVLFVSHNMQAIERLCDRTLLIRNGFLVRSDASTTDVIKQYLRGDERDTASSWTHDTGVGHAADNRNLSVLRFWIGDDEGNPIAMPADRNGSVWVYIDTFIHTPDPALNIGYAITSDTGALLYWSLTTDGDVSQWPRLAKGPLRVRSRLPTSQLNEGVFHITLIASLHYREWIFEPGANSPSITLTLRGKFSDSPLWMSRRPGLLAPHLAWETT